MIVIGFEGFHCAAAPDAASASAAASATRAKRSILMGFLLLGLLFSAGDRFNRFVKRLQRAAGLDYTSGPAKETPA
jgi:hypothetical protein